MGFLSSVAGGLVSGAFGLLGGKQSADAAAEANSANAALQREFAQQGIRWKVADAKAAGIHPLYALGAPTVQAAPSFVGDTGMGSAVANMGQDISRAITATRTSDERADAFASLQLENARLQNEFIKSQIAGSKVATLKAASNPPFPSSGDSLLPGAIGVSNRKPEPASTAYISRTGDVVHYPSNDAAEAIQDNIPYQLEHFYQNRIAPFTYGVLDSIRKYGGEAWRATRHSPYIRKPNR